MPQYDGYVRISTENDTSSARRSTEELGDTIHDAMDTTPVDNMTSSMERLNNSANSTDTSGLNDMRDGVDEIGESAITSGDLIRANLISDTVMSGLKQIATVIKNTGAQAVQTAMNNETAFAKVSTLLNGEDLEKYYQGLIDISNKTGVAFADLAESMYSALSAGVPKDNVLEFVEKTVNLSKGGFTQTATAIDIVTTALNAYQMEMFEATHVQDVLITTQNLGKTTVDELASSMGKLIPTANGVNITFDQLGAMYATVTANGVATAETTTYLNSMINELGASGSTAEKGMMAATEGTALAGKKFSEISAMGYDVTDVLQLMDDYARSTGKSLSDMFSSSEGGKAATILLSNMEGFKENISAMEQSAGAASAAAETMMNTTAEKVQVAKNQIDNLINTIADALLPVIGETAEEISAAAASGDLKETAEQIGKFASGTLILLLKNINLISSAVAGVTAGVVAFKTASVLTKVIASWQTAALQVNLFVASQGRAALQTAATNGTLTTQEVIFAALSGKLDAATIKTYALNTAMSLNPAGAIAAVVGLLATALTGYALCAGDSASASSELADKINDLKESLDHAKESAESNIAQGEAEMSMLKDKVARYDELRSAVELTSAEEAELKGIAMDLQDILGDNVSVINSLTGEYNDLSAAVDAFVQKQMTAVKLTAYEDMATEAYKAIYEAQNIIDEFQHKYGTNQLEQIKNGLREHRLDEGFTVDFFDEIAFDNQAREIKEQWNQALLDLSEAQSIIDSYESQLSENYIAKTTSDRTNLVLGSKYIAAEEMKKGQKNSSAEELAELYKQQRADAKYNYDMGVIDAREYYAKLAALRDKYLEADSDEWRSVNVEIKKYTDSLTASQLKAYEDSVKAQEQALKEAAQARITAFNDEKSLLQFQQKTGQISEKKYYEELAKIRDKYLEKNSKEWRNAFLETYQYNQQIIEANKDALNEMLSDAADSTFSALRNITSARDSLTAKLVDFNKTFEKITETVPETIAVKGEFTVTTSEHEVETYKMGASSIEDNIKILEEYGNMLDALKARGADEDTLNSILGMDIEEGMEFGSNLLKMSEKEWNSYFDSMAKLRSTAADISAKYYQDEVDNLRKNFIDKLREELFGLDSDMMSIGADAALSFVQGWNEALGSKDLTVGDMLYSLVGGTAMTAPKMAQLLSGFGMNMGTASEKQTDASGKTVIPIYIGTTKLTDIFIEGVNSKNIKVGKNVLNT